MIFMNYVMFDIGVGAADKTAFIMRGYGSVMTAERSEAACPVRKKGRTGSVPGGR
jgi:ABC-type sulfate transport system substrate-binding protein